MVGRDDAGLAVARKLGAVDKIEDGRVGAEVEISRAMRPRLSSAAQAPRRIGAISAAIGRSLAAAARWRTRPCGPWRSALLGQRDQLDHALVGFARAVAEGEDAVLVQDQSLDVGLGVEDLGRLSWRARNPA